MSSDSDHSALTSSLTDMMTSLMVIFVLLLVNYLGNQQEEVKAVLIENVPRGASACGRRRSVRRSPPRQRPRPRRG